ncbi:neuroendocrine convertase 1-like [Cydia pomonella]|uniref:neuroendocrine convertase 1-like n=1 Tax=Cydia pomonella TaxID=82600 RepID=UPI002ADE1A37|nr:neuroendocrine convertase 1-like [Cydia pomonella]
MLLFQTLLVTSLLNTIFSYNTFDYESVRPGDHGYYGVHDGLEHADMMNEWTVEVDGDEEVAQLIALELGYVYGGPVAGFPNTYSFLKYRHSKQRRTYGDSSLALIKDRRIRWAEPLFSKSRVKRYPTPEPDASLERVKRIDTQAEKRQKREVGRPLFNDELWGEEWYLQDSRNVRSLHHLDLNVLPVYAMGYTGRGVRVSVLDDGVEHNHTDLRDNYDPEISWDCNDGDPDPSPSQKDLRRNSHGTRCAGEIAMKANNVKCGVGVAWGAKVGGVRMLDGRITDRVEGEGIGYAWDKVDIYSASWGPNDDGRTVEGPGRLAMQAFKRGVTQGRSGKGVIYVWANGNGGIHQDNCNCDGYSSSIYTVSIGSASQHGRFPWYGEVCSSTLAVAYSSGARKDQKIATTDTNDSCTLDHTGTSAAAPLAAGIIALALEANSNLTWRDVQHLIAWTSDSSTLAGNPGWQINDVGLQYDVRFGFGLLNAEALVSRALNWITVPEKHVCHIPPQYKINQKLSSGQQVNIYFGAHDCPVKYVEHVELVINMHYSKRGALEVYLTSVRGTRVQLLSARPEDTSNAAFSNWPLMSVATWGENPKGVWHAVILDDTNEANIGEVGETTLIIHGTNETPAHMKHLLKEDGIPNGDTDNENNTKHLLEEAEVTNEDISSINENIFSNLLGVEDHNVEVEPSLLAAVEKQLFRMHHRKVNRPAGL